MLSSPTLNLVGKKPSAIATGDLNGDGTQDIVIADKDTSNVYVLLNGKAGQLAAPVAYPAAGAGNNSASTNAVALADLNGDGKLDVIVANRGLSDPNPGSIGVLLGAGDGTLRPVQIFPGGYRPTAIALADFNNDGKLDLAVAGYGSDSTGGNPGSVAILLGEGAGTFQAPVVVGSFPDRNAITIVAGDFNGDGRVDLAVGTFKFPNSPATVSVLLGRGDGTFQPAVSYPLGSTAGSALAEVNFLTAGDLNGDGKPDLVALIFDSDSAWKISMLPGNGDGTFGPAIFKPTEFGPGHAVITDLNGMACRTW